MFEISYPAIGAIGAFLTALAIVGGFWGRFSERVTKAQTTAENAEKEATNAGIQLVASRLEVDRLVREFADYQTKAALMFVTDRELNVVEQRISQSVEEIKNDIRGVNSRLDRVLDNRETNV